MSIRHITRRAAGTLGVISVAMLASAAPAAAHPADDAQLGGGLNGFLHPILGLDHLAAMLAVGVIAALAFRKLPVWAAPAAFLVGMVGGGALGFAGVEGGSIELVIAGSVVAFGVIIALATRLPLGAWLLPAVALVGAAHGNAHGLEAPTAATPVAYVVGFLFATALLHASGALVGHVLRRFEVGQLVGGAAIATFGVTLFAG